MNYAEQSLSLWCPIYLCWTVPKSLIKSETVGVVATCNIKDEVSQLPQMVLYKVKAKLTAVFPAGDVFFLNRVLTKSNAICEYN